VRFRAFGKPIIAAFVVLEMCLECAYNSCNSSQYVNRLVTIDYRFQQSYAAQTAKNLIRKLLHGVKVHYFRVEQQIYPL
jgi:hypothetical protein